MHSQIALYIVWDPNSPVSHRCLSSVLSGTHTHTLQHQDLAAYMLPRPLFTLT